MCGGGASGVRTYPYELGGSVRRTWEIHSASFPRSYREICGIEKMI